MFEKILVCLDGSTLAEQILPYATEQAKKFKSKVTLIQAVPTPSSVPSATGSVTGPALKEQVDAEQHKAQLYLGKIATELANEGVNADYKVVSGTPGHAIVQYSRENAIELIAIATHGHSGIKRAVLGSVADHVVRQSHLPMLVIKPKQA